MPRSKQAPRQENRYRLGPSNTLLRAAALSDGKDLRTGVSTSNTGAVLDGDIDQFVEAALAQKASAPRPKNSKTSNKFRVTGRRESAMDCCTIATMLAKSATLSR